jgi:beta propeller domain-containing protein
MLQRQIRAWGTVASIPGGCAFILGLVACGSEATTDPGFARVQGDLSTASEDGAGNAATANDAALSSASSCDVLLAQLQNDLLEQVHERAEQARISPDYYYYGGGVFIDDVAPELGTAAPVASAPVSSPAVPSAAAPRAAAAPAFAGARFSETTVQVPGVDEADFVKAEGDRIYLLQGNSLYVLDAHDARATQVVSSTLIEGSPSDLYVRDGRVLVTSTVSGPLPGQEEDPYYYYYYSYPSYAKLTVLDTRGDSVGVLRESFVEGYSGGSRRHGSVVRSLVQQQSKVQLDYPTVSYFDIFGNRRSQAEIDLQVDLWVLLTSESIEDSVVEDYLPETFERVDGALVEQPVRCGDYLLPGPGLFNAGATSIVSLDLDALDAPLGTATLLGYAEGVFANDDVLLIRQTDYGDYTQPLATYKTNIHRFALDGAATTYTASGSVAGYLSTSFGLDEADGVIRTVASEDRYQIEPVDGGESYIYLGTSNRVVTLEAEGSELVEIGHSQDIDTDGYVYQSRFVGDYGYLFTYNQLGIGANDMFVVDVSNAAAPALVGQTTTDDYVGVLVPLRKDQLLSVSQVIDPTGQSFSQMALQLFDVSDPTAPSLASEHVFAAQGYTDASYDARAISFHPQRGLLSLPFQNYDSGQSTLEVFNVALSGGLEHLASLVPTGSEPTLLECLTFLGYSVDPEFLQFLEENPEYVESFLTECSYYWVATARRGLFRGDDLFAVDTLGIDAYSVYALSGPPIGEVDLPPAYPYYYYPYAVPLSAPVPATPGPIEGIAPAPSRE